MKSLLAALVMILWAGTALALPPAVELDRLMLHAKTALERKSYDEAAGQLAQAQKLGIALPEDFSLSYATALAGQGRVSEAKDVLDKYLNKYATKGPSYKAVLELLVRLEDQENGKSQTRFQPAPVAGMGSNWGLADQDLSTMMGGDIMKKVHMAEHRAEILAAAQAGDKLSQYLIGASFEYGIGVNKDAAQKVVWLTKSAEQGLMRARAALALARISGSGTAQDDISGWTMLLESSNSGNAVAQYLAAMLTLTGLDSGGGMTRQFRFLSKPDALALLRRSAEAGLSAAQYALGHSYLVGTELNSKDMLQARYWLKKAADQHFPAAETALASMPQSN